MIVMASETLRDIMPIEQLLQPFSGNSTALLVLIDSCAVRVVSVAPLGAPVHWKLLWRVSNELASKCELTFREGEVYSKCQVVSAHSLCFGPRNEFRGSIAPSPRLIKVPVLMVHTSEAARDAYSRTQHTGTHAALVEKGEDRNVYLAVVHNSNGECSGQVRRNKRV
jgi:hypothetical protein